MKAIEIKNLTLIGSYDEVENVPLSTIVKDDKSDAVLNGMIIRGYETKFSNTANENGEVYERDCLNDYIENYFVKNKLNIPVDIQHNKDIYHLAGRVLIVEVNSVGFYFVVYVPKTFINYDSLRGLLKEGIIQGFSKYGWATDYEFIYQPNGDYSYMKVNQMSIVNVSLVSTPANALPFEKVQEVKDATKLIVTKDEVLEDPFGDMFP